MVLMGARGLVLWGFWGGVVACRGLGTGRFGVGGLSFGLVPAQALGIV